MNKTSKMVTHEPHWRAVLRGEASPPLIAGGAYGTLMTLDTLASSQQSIATIGEDRVFQSIQAALALHNALVDEKMAQLVDTTTDRQRRYGGLDAMVMDEIDEIGTPDAQKVAAGVTVGFPLRLYGVAVQWTRKFLQNATAAELAAQFIAAQDADVMAIDREIKRAIFRSANYAAIDRLVDNVTLNVKRLVNADSAAIPPAPDGTTFNAATHTHYLATAALVQADVVALIDTVNEHHQTGQVIVYIPKGHEAAVRAFAGFAAYVDPRVVQPSTSTYAGGVGLDMLSTNNRAIGILSGAEIWVKSWIPTGYMFAWQRGAPKPLVKRQRPGAGNLEVAFDDESHPLRARGLEREFGVAVWTRTAGAVLYTGGAAYVDPTIN